MQAAYPAVISLPSDHAPTPLLVNNHTHFLLPPISVMIPRSNSLPPFILKYRSPTTNRSTIPSSVTNSSTYPATTSPLPPKFFLFSVRNYHPSSWHRSFYHPIFRHQQLRLPCRPLFLRLIQRQSPILLTRPVNGPAHHMAWCLFLFLFLFFYFAFAFV